MNTITKEQLLEKTNRVRLYTMYSLLDRATKKMRGITANWDGTDLLIEMFFDCELTEDEEEEMQIANTEVVSDLYQEFKGMYLNLTVIKPSVSLYDKKGNLGWFYLRKEYAE
ncbi:hypothetical protein RHO14_10055 [Orbus wheelerorum]|uniref:hypothetical protein n=1 Tax=Orbus wheelerorum TaxID=3074111 RepID=UPI00370DB29F